MFMIERTFLMLDRIGRFSEAKLWKQGLKHWDAFLQARSVKGISQARKQAFDKALKLFRRKLYDYDSEFIALKLPKTEHWRLYSFFKDQALFLDIETSGFRNDVTVIGVYSEDLGFAQFVKGLNLDFKALQRFVDHSKILITFNGSSFDIPILQKKGLTIRKPHIDLRFVCSKLSLNNGLKTVEKSLGIARPEPVVNMQGFDAVSLWHNYKIFKSKQSLKLLLQYNEEDVVNLSLIADKVVPLLEKKTLHENIVNAL